MSGADFCMKSAPDKEMFKQINMKKIFTLLFVLQLLYGCGHENSSEFTHIPFQTKDSDRWGLIGIDGKILFENKFSNAPSVVINGIFYVKNKDGLYEYYYAKEKPERINDKVYSGVIPFYEDITPVTEPEQHISFIRKDGSPAFMFDFYEGQKIVSVSKFSDGLAAFMTKDKKYGYINTKGKVVIPPKFTGAQEFSEGLAVVWENGTRFGYMRAYENDLTAFVINKKGEKQFDLDVKPDIPNNYVWFGSFRNGLLACGECNEPNASLTGIKYYLNRRGKKKLLDMLSNIYILTDFNSSDFALCSQQIDKETYLRIISKYGRMVTNAIYEYNYYRHLLQDGYYINDDLACISNTGGYGNFELIDFKGNIICPFQFDRITPFYNGKYAFAGQDGEYFLINKKGKQVDDRKFAIAYEHLEHLKDYLRSDYREENIEKDIDKLFENIQENKIEEIYLGMSVEEIRKVRNIDYVNAQYYNGERIYKLLSGINFENIKVEYTLFLDRHISNSDARVKYIAIHVFLKEPIEGEYFYEGENKESNERIEKVVKNTVNRLNYKYKFDEQVQVYSSSSTFQFYQKNSSDYSMRLLKSGTADMFVTSSGYEILICSINEINELNELNEL
jgi:hypothetical protein